MATKSMSTRASICGRGAGCKGGHCAVEQSAYISREKMDSEYDGQTYYPKYSEDLVHSEVLLPENAPAEYKDPSVLWNSVEMFEKTSDAQLARIYKVELPNEWSYDLAKEVVRDYINRNFVSKGMCVQYAIHDSENEKTGQRNLHCHMMLALRSIDENGKWMPKQKKVYLTDENGERIPLIDKKTGLQKVDNQNRKQWKCKTVQTNDWNSKDNAKVWRKDLADTINSVNVRMGITENFWEHRSFAEQGLERIPQIHLGEKASALEREGIHTVRGDINRDIIAHNLAIDMARMAYEKALKELEKAKELAVMVAENIKNEILDAIRKVAERNHNRLKLPIVKGKYIGSISDRASLQNRSKMESYVHGKGWTTFEEMNAEKKSLESRYKQFEKDMNKIGDRMEYLEKLLKLYKKLEPYKKINDEYFKLKNGESKKGTFFGFGKSLAEKYKMEHQTELNTYKMMKNALTGMIDEQDKRIKPVAWKKEYEDLEMKYEKCEDSIYDIVPDLAKMEVLDYNKRDLDRMLINESHKRGRDIINERLASAKEKANEYNVQIFDSVTEHSGINHSREDR